MASKTQSAHEKHVQTAPVQDFAGTAAEEADVAAHNMAVIHQENTDAESARALVASFRAPTASAAAGCSTEKTQSAHEKHVQEFNDWKKKYPIHNFTGKNINVQTLVDSCNKGIYELNPQHQRNVVHNTKWQSQIVISVIRGYPLGSPEFDTVQHTQGKNAGLDYYRSLDGKQRLSAIIRLINNEYKFDANIKSIKGKKFKDWPSVWRNKLLRSDISISITNSTLSDEEVSDYFNKKQNTKKTNPGETFNAKLTRRAILCKELCNTMPFPVEKREKDNRYTLLELYIRLNYAQYAMENKINNIDPTKKTLEAFLEKSEETDTIKFNQYGTRIKEIINIVNSYTETTKDPWAKTQMIPLMFLYYKYQDQFEMIKQFIKTNIEGNNTFYESVGGNHNASAVRCKIIEESYTQWKLSQTTY